MFEIKILSEETCSLGSFSGGDDCVKVPSRVEKDGREYMVVKIDDYAFYYGNVSKTTGYPEGIGFRLRKLEIPEDLISKD